MDLAQTCQPPLKLREGAFKHLAMTGILYGLKLLKHSPAGEFKRFPLLLPGGLFGVSRCFDSISVLTAACCSSTDLLSHPRAIFPL